MAENYSSVSPLDGRRRPGLSIVAASSDPVTIEVAEDEISFERGGPASTSARAPSARPACAGRVSWMTIPQPEVRHCVLPHGHGGDHRDVAGYPWNDGRWWD